jgi:hypothetical protein
MSAKSKPNPPARSGETIVDVLIEVQDQFSIGERLRLAAAIADQVAKDKVPERAQLGRLRALQIVDAVARDLKR